MDEKKLTETLKFLLSSVSKLSDRFVEFTEVSRREFDSDAKDINSIIERLSHIEADLTSWRDQQLIGDQASARLPKELPVKPGQENVLIPTLGLSKEQILDIYSSSPALLQPFSRSCSVSGRTLSGMIDEIELEVFAQGTAWLIETQDGHWLLFPKPGLMSRKSQIQNLRRFFDIENEIEPPAELDLLEPGTADAVEHGRRWYLSEKGRIGLQADPLKISPENRLVSLEARLKRLEEWVSEEINRG